MTAKCIRWGVRLAFLAAAVFFSLGGPFPAWLGRLFPSLSPFVVFAASVAGRRWYLSVFWLLPPVAFMCLAWWQPRSWCRWICPAGTMLSLVPRRCCLKKAIVKRKASGFLFWAAVGGALAGAPILLWLDPLSSFSRLGVIWNRTYTVAALMPGAVLPACLLLGLIQPMVWCTHICPLGYLAGLPRRWTAVHEDRVDRTRREVIAGLVVGIPLGLLASRLPAALGAAERSEPPILPPGARDLDTFTELCTRCYACVHTCPTKAIRVRSSAGRHWRRLFHPELDPIRGYCEELCNRCSHVCSAGALLPLTAEEKSHRQIGVARVTRDTCLAWAYDQYCMVCQEFCPYHAIRADHADGSDVPRPVVDPAVCRGCGICQHNCPSLHERKAITVVGLRRQGTAIDSQT